MAAGSAAETVIGAVVIAAAGAFLVFAADTASIGNGVERYELEASFRRADGVATGTDVRVSGVRVGSVTGLELNPQTYQAVVSMAIDAEVRLPEDSDARIESDGLLGGSYVAITPGASDFMIEPGGQILNTQGSVSLLDLIVRFGTSMADE
ncbi:MAG: outer membrane lipid asymmetry maintenance protein MlaD [Rubricella sp.]